MDAIILQENIEGLLSLVRMLLPGGGSAGCVYLDDLSALQRSIHEKINDLYSQRGETPEQAVLTRSLSLLDVLPPSLLKQQLSAVCYGMQELCEIN